MMKFQILCVGSWMYNTNIRPITQLQQVLPPPAAQTPCDASKLKEITIQRHRKVRSPSDLQLNHRRYSNIFPATLASPLKF
jgi:hypothetical protein